MSSFHLQIDRPGGILLQNLNQDFVGWVALDSSQSLRNLRFEFNRQPMNVEYFQRADAQAAMPFAQVFGWMCRTDREHVQGWQGKAIEFTVSSQREVIYRKTFLRTRSLLGAANDSPLFFMHIPKTAGTALRQLVDYVFSELPSLFVYGQYPGIDANEIACLKRSHLDSREIVFGHFGYDFVSGYEVAQPKIITILREPVRLLESYRKFGADLEPKFFDNPLVRHLSDAGYLADYGKVRKSHFDQALSNLHNHVFALRAENLQAFADSLTQAFNVGRFEVPQINTNTLNIQGVQTEGIGLTQFDDRLYAEASPDPGDFFEFLNAAS